eukprot:scaffold11722_cov172-Skeletonema_dohrnii-CCMP3373.AAC.5
MRYGAMVESCRIIGEGAGHYEQTWPDRCFSHQTLQNSEARETEQNSLNEKLAYFRAAAAIV